MATYEFQGNYEAFRDGRRFGPWTEGDVVQLDAADAEWIERDSPGIVSKVGSDSDLAAPPAPGGGARPRVNGDPDRRDVVDAVKERLDAESVFRQTATGDGVMPGATHDADESDVPAGSAAEVLAWVGSDPDRAHAALDAERRRNQPRTGLTSGLERIAAQRDDAEREGHAAADRQHRGGANRAS